MSLTGARKQKSSYSDKTLRHHQHDVGYGKPPRAHQFKPGNSGNPRPTQECEERSDNPSRPTGSQD